VGAGGGLQGRFSIGVRHESMRKYPGADYGEGWREDGHPPANSGQKRHGDRGLTDGMERVRQNWEPGSEGTIRKKVGGGETWEEKAATGSNSAWAGPVVVTGGTQVGRRTDRKKSGGRKGLLGLNKKPFAGMD